MRRNRNREIAFAAVRFSVAVVMTSTPVPSWLMMMTVALVVKRSENGKLKGEEMYWKFNWQTEEAGADEKGSIWWERYLFYLPRKPLCLLRNTLNEWQHNKWWFHFVEGISSLFSDVKISIFILSSFTEFVFVSHQHSATPNWWFWFRFSCHDLSLRIILRFFSFRSALKTIPHSTLVSVAFHSEEKWIHHDDEAEGSSWTRKGRIDS